MIIYLRSCWGVGSREVGVGVGRRPDFRRTYGLRVGVGGGGAEVWVGVAEEEEEEEEDVSLRENVEVWVSV